MPRMNGYETAQQIRLGGYAGPILALSASAMNSDREKALAAGCNEHISKPINRAELLRVLHQLVN